MAGLHLGVDDLLHDEKFLFENNFLGEEHEKNTYKGPHSKLEGYMQMVINKNNLQFFQLSRVTKETFRMLLDMISTHETFQQQNNHGGKERIGTDISLMITLWYLGRQCTYSEISQQFGIPLSTAHRQIEKVIDVINEIYKYTITWPSLTDVPKVEEEFKTLSNFPGVIAAIDGCHIKIKAPDDHQKDYLDRTMNHSVNLLAACDANKKYVYVFAGFPGSAHDQRILSLSPLGTKLEKDYKSLCYSNLYHIIGDSAFALKPYMMVPYRDTGDLDAKKLNYNTKLSMTRRVIENSFAWLKGRFRRLKFIDADLKRTSCIVTAACILHNITLDFAEERELLENSIDGDIEPAVEVLTQSQVNDSAKGTHKRNQIMQSL